jgi:hypothetical protein
MRPTRNSPARNDAADTFTADGARPRDEPANANRMSRPPRRGVDIDRLTSAEIPGLQQRSTTPYPLPLAYQVTGQRSSRANRSASTPATEPPTEDMEAPSSSRRNGSAPREATSHRSSARARAESGAILEPFDRPHLSQGAHRRASNRARAAAEPILPPFDRPNLGDTSIEESSTLSARPSAAHAHGAARRAQACTIATACGCRRARAFGTVIVGRLFAAVRQHVCRPRTCRRASASFRVEARFTRAGYISRVDLA